MALMSGKVYSDVGVPSNTIGEQGDIFMQLDGLKITYRKEGVAWTPIGNQLGTIPEFIEGNGIPSNILGEDGQYYRDVTTQVIYKKNTGVWNNIGSWTSLATSNILTANGIGVDLGGTNNIPAGDLNDIIEVGEYSFPSTLTNVPYRVVNSIDTDYGGLLKVWRKDATNISQFVETTNGLTASRTSSDGGTTWTDWVFAANEGGNSGIRFKVLDGVLDEEATNLLQVKTLLQHYYVSTEGGSINNGVLELKNNRGGLGLTQFRFNLEAGGVNPTIAIAPYLWPQPAYCNGVWLSKVGTGAVPTLTAVTATTFTVNNPSGEPFYWIALVDF